jgi:hypothetical protein
MTVNELMSLMKTVRDRVNTLKALRQQLAVRERYFTGQTETHISEPQYDIKKVDAKIMSLENFLFLADSSIKQSNAKTQIKGITVSIDELLAPIE